jgi:predicted transcriptional regulator YdeE
MKSFTREKLDEMTIIGISTRTTNKDGQARHDIGALWSRFMEDNFIEKIPGKESQDIYCVYSDYESDFNGPYTTVLGCRVEKIDEVPEGLTMIKIPTCSYHVYESSGEMPKALVDTWTYIWNSETERSYIADFDVYSHEPVIKTYVSIKNDS